MISLREFEQTSTAFTSTSVLIFGGPKFCPFLDLGVMKPPPNYAHYIRLDTFRREFGHMFRYFDKKISDENYIDVMTKLSPHRSFRVEIVCQTVERTNSQEQLNYLHSRKAIHIGPQGMSVIWEMSESFHIWGGRYMMLDIETNLWHNGAEPAWIPVFDMTTKNKADFVLASFDRVWGINDYFFCVTPV